jgi:Na+-translocating ferredoxin:NAD+ oxidoreductase RnfG subunit
MIKIARVIFVSVFFVGALCLSPSAKAQTTVFLKPEEAIKLIFKDSQEVIKEDHPVTSEVQQKASKLLGYELEKSDYPFYLGRTNGIVDGYAVIDDEVGKVLPITFITRINPDGKVAAVEIMVYRESHGGEVTSRRFLNQFREKSLNDELRLHGNIVNVTGATLSSQALVKGVKRALALWQIFYGK